LVDLTVQSAEDAKKKGLSSGLKWNPGRGNRLLILHLIGPNGLVHEMERIWIRKAGTIQSEDYHNDITAETMFEWFRAALEYLPQNSVIVIDNASVHNKVSQRMSIDSLCICLSWATDKFIFGQ
jgi:hypothetical protein